MSQPPSYSPGTDFSAEEANNVGGRSTVRTAQLDAEFSAIDVTLDALLANLALIQRDDGEIRDGKVKIHTLASDVKALLAAAGVVVRGAWLTATVYAAKDIVTQGGVTYICAVTHTSGTFATDLAAVKWLSLSSTQATDVSFTPQAGIVATTVSAALAELGNQVGDGVASIGFRNRIINGDMRIDQRNVGAAVTINTAAYSYTVDRWKAFGQAADGVFTVQQLTSGTPPDTYTHYLRAKTTTADASIAAGQIYILIQAIEGYNVADLAFGTSAAKAVTVSFWVRSSLTGTFSGSLTNGGFTRAYPFTFAINVANTWEQKTVTIPGDTTGAWATDNNAGFYLFFDLGCGSTGKGTASAWTGTAVYGVTGATNLIGTLNATFDLTGVQLEAGSSASPFERRPYGMEFALCQRYYQVGTGSVNQVGTAGQNFGMRVIFPVVMRGTADLTGTTFSYSNASTGVTDNATAVGFRFYAAATASASAEVICAYKASAEL
jgi:hypothetical protein